MFSNKRISRIIIEIFSSIVSRYFNEKDITINSNHRFAHKDEFVSQLGISKDDAKYYTEFGKNIDSLEKTISKTTFSKNWIDGKTELEFFKNKLISVSFNSSDKFTREVRGDIVEYISLVNDAWNINQSIKKNIKVKFYGFRKSKGDVVSGITSSSYETVPPENTDKFKDTCKTIYIGLPYSIRATNSSVSSEIKNAINARLDQEVR